MNLLTIREAADQLGLAPKTVRKLIRSGQLRGVIWKPLAAKNLRMHANDKHLLIVGTIEDADSSAFGKPARRAPEKIMFQLPRRSAV